MDGSPGGGADPSPSWNSWILILKIGRSSIRVSQSQGLTTMPSAKLPAIGGKANKHAWDQGSVLRILDCSKGAKEVLCGFCPN